MTAVRIRTCLERGKVTDLSDLRPPTDVMAITSLPQVPANHPVSGFPLSVYLSRHLPPGAATRHLKCVHIGQHVVLSHPQNSPKPN